MVLHEFMIVVESYGGVVSIVGSIRAQGGGERSVVFVCLGPVYLLGVWGCWCPRILMWEDVEAC